MWVLLRPLQAGGSLRKVTAQHSTFSSVWNGVQHEQAEAGITDERRGHENNQRKDDERDVDFAQMRGLSSAIQ
jgi:hypothetical protein